MDAPSTPPTLNSTTTPTGVRMTLHLECYGCKAENPDQLFCGQCGEPLALSSFVEQRMQRYVHGAVIGKDVMERESSILVADRVMKWFTHLAVVAGIISTVAVATIAFVGWSKYQDLDAATDSARKLIVQKTAEFSSTTTQAKALIDTAAKESQANATRTSAALASQVANTTRQLQTVQEELRAASGIRDEVQVLRRDLSDGRREVKAVQETLADQQKLVRSIFSGMKREYFVPELTTSSGKAATFPPKVGVSDHFWIYAVLDHCPIPQTVQLQYHIFAQPAGSHHIFDCNVLFFNWKAPLAGFKTHALSVSYIADETKKPIAKSVAVREEKLFVNDQVRTDFNAPDVKRTREY